MFLTEKIQNFSFQGAFRYSQSPVMMVIRNLNTNIQRSEKLIGEAGQRVGKWMQLQKTSNFQHQLVRLNTNQGDRIEMLGLHSKRFFMLVCTMLVASLA